MKAEKSSERMYRYSFSSVSSQESSPVDKRPKNVSSSGDSEDEDMVASNLSESTSRKVDLILLKFDKLDFLEQKLDDVSTAVSSLKRSVAALEMAVALVKEKQKLSEDNIKEIRRTSNSRVEGVMISKTLRPKKRKTANKNSVVSTKRSSSLKPIAA